MKNIQPLSPPESFDQPDQNAQPVQPQSQVEPESTQQPAYNQSETSYQAAAAPQQTFQRDQNPAPAVPKLQANQPVCPQPTASAPASLYPTAVSGVAKTDDPAAYAAATQSDEVVEGTERLPVVGTLLLSYIITGNSVAILGALLTIMAFVRTATSAVSYTVSSSFFSVLLSLVNATIAFFVLRACLGMMKGSETSRLGFLIYMWITFALALFAVVSIIATGAGRLFFGYAPAGSAYLTFALVVGAPLFVIWYFTRARIKRCFA